MLLTEFSARNLIPNLKKKKIHGPPRDDNGQYLFSTYYLANIVLSILMYYLMYQQPHKVGPIIISFIVEEMAA